MKEKRGQSQALASKGLTSRAVSDVKMPRMDRPRYRTLGSDAQVEPKEHAIKVEKKEIEVASDWESHESASRTKIANGKEQILRRCGDPQE